MSNLKEQVSSITVEVMSVKHLPKCQRCLKYDSWVGQDVVFDNLCSRCSSVMHTIFYDLHHRHYSLLPPNLSHDVDLFINTYVRESLRGLSWVGINKKYKNQGGLH